MGFAIRLLKQYRTLLKQNPKTRLPRLRKDVLELDGQFYTISNGVIRIPLCLGEYLYIPLQKYVLERLDGMKPGGVRITSDRLTISYAQNVEKVMPDDWAGVDFNERNATIHDTRDNTTVISLGRIPDTQTKCRGKVANFKRNDVRKRKKIAAKYGKKERDLTNDMLHKAAKFLILSGFGIVLEDLMGIREQHRCGSKMGKGLRGRINAWPFYRLRNFIEYKAREAGLPVVFVPARGTSSLCAECGGKVRLKRNRMVHCRTCDTLADRDENASKNILFRGPGTRARLGACEAMMEESPGGAVRLVDVCSMQKGACLRTDYA